MKLFSVVCFCIVVLCVSGSDGFKLLKKLKEVLHPTEPTTTIVPILPSYENHREHEEHAVSNIKSNHSGEDTSSSESVEDPGVGFHSKNKNHDHSNGFYSKGPQTTTYRYEESNYNYGESSLTNSGDNIKSTTPRNYNFDQNEREKESTGQSSFTYSGDNIKSTTPRNYNFDQNEREKESTGQSSFTNSGDNIKSTTPRNYNFGQNEREKESTGQSSFTNSGDNIKLTTPRNYNFDQNERDKESTGVDYPKNNQPFEGVTLNEFLSVTSTTTRSQYQNNDEQSLYSGDESTSTTTSSYGANENYNPQQSSSSGTYANQQSSSSTGPLGSANPEGQSSPFNDDEKLSQNAPEQSYPDAFNGGFSTTTSKYYIEPGAGQSPATIIGGNQQTSSKHGTKQSGNTDGGIIVFPDNPILNPTPEPERIFGEHDPNFKTTKEKFKSIPAPVAVDDGRNIIKARGKECGPGETFNARKNKCGKLERK
ncbi:mucin-21-like [Macrosteles quadrilineatus]|uniref:mucin-21-like n=1 Tax=Macrosteles quadrilineatus TaxID=74068 RepID=UPI0023E3200A|nr:mucin-21-like [Macrosteles quadrilineatus]